MAATIMEERYIRLGITEEMRSDFEQDVAFSKGTDWCPAPFLAPDNSTELLCALKAGHPDHHKAVEFDSAHGATQYFWPEVPDEKACDDHLKRKYYTYTPSDVVFNFEESLVDVDAERR